MHQLRDFHTLPVITYNDYIALTFKLEPSICLNAAAGRLMYHGPCNQVMGFFQGMGFDLPERKGIPDFLQEVTGCKDQEVGLLTYQISASVAVYASACGLVSWS